MSAYLLVWRPNKVWYIGPFDDAGAAYDWAADNKNDPNDDPSWTVLPMVRPRAPLEVVPPIAPMPDSSAVWKLAEQMYPRYHEVDDDGLTDWEKRLRRLTRDDE